MVWGPGGTTYEVKSFNKTSLLFIFDVLKVYKVYSTANFTSFGIKNVTCETKKLKVLKRRKILRLDNFIYHIGMYLAQQKTFFLKNYLICSDPHIIS